MDASESLEAGRGEARTTAVGRRRPGGVWLIYLAPESRRARRRLPLPLDGHYLAEDACSEASGYPTGTSLWRVFVPSWQFQNYLEAWNAAPFARYFLNTILVALTVTACVLVTSVLAGYAFAAINFPAKNALFILILATMMIPPRPAIFPIS